MKKIKILHLKATTLSPFFTGSTVKRRANGVNLPINIDGDDRVIMNLQVVRAYLEKILSDKGIEVCTVGTKGAKGCGKCVLCDMFGYLGHSGRIKFEFLKSEQPASEIVDKATKIRINRESGSVSDSLTMEQVPSGVNFRGKIVILNPKETDIPYLKSAFKAIEEIGLGGWTRRGYGRVKIEIVKEEDKDWSDYLKEAK